MENTITISVSENYHEQKKHGDTAFPFASYTTSGNSLDVPWHWHEEYELSIVRKGHIPCSVGMENFILEEGDGLFINTGTLHSFPLSKTSPSICKEDILFHGRLIYGSKYTVFWKKYISPIASAHSLPYIHLSASVGWQGKILGYISKAVRLSHDRPDGYEFMIRDALSHIFLLLCENCSTQREDAPEEHIQEILHVKRIIGCIQQNFHATITLAELAARALRKSAIAAGFPVRHISVKPLKKLSAARRRNTGGRDEGRVFLIPLVSFLRISICFL